MIAAPDPSSSVADLLWRRATATPDRRAYLFLDERGGEREEFSYAALARRAHAIAEALLTVANPGDRAVFLFEPGMVFLEAFFGCLYAGIVAVPMMPPKLRRDGQVSWAILRDCAPRLVLTTQALAGRLEQSLSTAGLDPFPRFIAIDEIGLRCSLDAAAAPRYRAAADDVAFLQYTSGSTALPKGVMVTHGNLRANARMIAAAMQQDETSNFVGWAPLYHDQGLIGNVLQPLHLGAPAVLMAPNTFLQRPHLWLEAIDRYRAHTSGGPDFAFGLIADRIATKADAGLDLSCWKVAFNGAEPIRPAVLERFAASLAPFGFAATALYPCYGLAEATLFASGARPGEGAVIRGFDRLALGEGKLDAAADGVRLASSGRMVPELSVAIVDPESRVPLPDSRIGEIWLAGPSIARGYWMRPDATREVFQACAADGRGPYLATGDLGAIVDGELYVCGRVKDLIIIRGRNLYPQDLEITALAAHSAVSQGKAVAAAVMIGGLEKLLLAVEINRMARHDADPDAVSAAIRRAIREDYDVVIDRLVLLRPGGIPKTTSGKVRRRALAEAFAAGQLTPWRRDREPADAALWDRP
jgi:acyl-CoA synthetase (AMP-forming)/AMP-acid ligase II